MLFLFVFCYLCIRSVYTEPLHDEIATFYFYIYHGDFVGSDLVFDANNHILNSALGFVLYRMFGENFFVFRLPNLLSFPIYFYALYQLMRYVKSESLKTLGLAALVCIPFIVEYFAYCRGYGIGIAFFVLGIHFLIKYIQSERSRFLILTFLSCWIAVFANLVFINFSILVLAYLLFYVIVNRTKWKPIVGWSSLFILGLSPFVFFAFKLKQAGALYYGSLEGLWDVTGKSLSEMVFFTGNNFVFVGVTTILLILFGKWILQLAKRDWNVTTRNPLFIINFFLFASLGMILILAIVLKVNYPEDRTGMYLIPLFIVAIIFNLDSPQWTKHLKWILLFFPISFCIHLSIHSSIYSPDQRMSESFYKKVKAYMKPSYSLSSYHMNYWTWNWMDSKEKNQSSVLLYNHSDSPVYDVILGKKNTIHNPKVFELYDTLAFDPLTHDVAFIRKKPLVKKLLFESPVVNVRAEGEYVTIYETDSFTIIPFNKTIQVSVDFTLITQTKKHYLELVVQTIDENGASIEQMNYPIAFVYRDQLINEHLLHHFVLEKFSDQTKALKIFLWNKGSNPLEIKNGKCYLYEVKNP